MNKTKEALELALDALEEIALAGMSGSGQESPEGMRDWHAQQAWKFIGIAARVLRAAREALAEQEQEPVAIPGPDAERIAILLDKVVRMYPFKRDTEGYEALHLARRIAFRYTIKGDPPLYTSPPAQQEPVAIVRRNPSGQLRLEDSGGDAFDISAHIEGTRFYTHPTPANQQASVPDSYKLVPVEPTEDQWGGLARDIVMWMDMDGRKTPASLLKHLNRLGRSVPQWLLDEAEMKNLDHVPSKGTRAAIIYKAMLAAAPEAPAKEWQELSEEEIEAFRISHGITIHRFYSAISATLRAKNGGGK